MSETDVPFKFSFDSWREYARGLPLGAVHNGEVSESLEDLADRLSIRETEGSGRMGVTIIAAGTEGGVDVWIGIMVSGSIRVGRLGRTRSSGPSSCRIVRGGIHEVHAALQAALRLKD